MKAGLSGNERNCLTLHSKDIDIVVGHESLENVT